MTEFLNNNKQLKSRQRVADHGEVFTNAREVNAMLDLVKQETERIDSRFLEPACGEGIFLMEVLRRKLNIPDKQERLNHIFSKQLFGIAITELTSFLSRKSVYCSKIANGRYSICETFYDEQGNIRYN